MINKFRVFRVTGIARQCNSTMKNKQDSTLVRFRFLLEEGMQLMNGVDESITHLNLTIHNNNITDRAWYKQWKWSLEATKIMGYRNTLENQKKCRYKLRKYLHRYEKALEIDFLKSLGTKYLSVIDRLSRMANVKPLTNNSGLAVKTALLEVFRTMRMTVKGNSRQRTGI